ncbi:hypothetical protein [Stutzerimonas stutzeri]|uniref:Uncharacterized protein n=1 Tax=Stutzerimonas stutzeri TaxID=316 RepID=A0A5S5BC27_STUST|nr:hypothetical protein [Stutzerimonas stutzeri]TYP64018.1 hypothetical protein A9A72_123801 [Stutzerimonas stutzeri]
MASKFDLEDWIIEALKQNGGSAKLLRVSEFIWRNHRDELERSIPLLYIWQYETRWAATRLRKKGLLKAAVVSPKGVWELQESDC